jgi:hypothetical protein
MENANLRILGFGLALVVASAGCVQSESPRAAVAPVPGAAASRYDVREGSLGAAPENTAAPGEVSAGETSRMDELDEGKPTPAAAWDLPDAPFRAPLDAQETESQRLARRIANASPAACRAELRRRKLAVSFLSGNVKGVATPVRLTGALRGVRFATPGKSSVYGILDCRLAVVLDELAELFSAQGVVAVHVDNLYRPRAHLPGRRKKSQHAYGLAIDIHGFTLADGTTLSIERDFHGTVGATPCGPGADLGPQGDARAFALRNVVCEIARSGLFNYLLTPSYDAAHRNHLHADIARGATGHVLR